MKAIRILTCTTLAAIGFLSCSDMGSNGIPIPYENVPQTDCFAIPLPGELVISDDSTWLSLWDQYWHCYDDSGKAPPPTIDFNQNMLIAVF